MGDLRDFPPPGLRSPRGARNRDAAKPTLRGPLPELPDIELYVEALRARVLGEPLERVRIKSPFVLRSVDPPVSAAEGKVVRDVRRVGKRIALVLDDDVAVVLHLMIAGRLSWKKVGTKPTGRMHLASFDFPEGVLLFTEAASKHRAAMNVVRGDPRQLDAGGLEPLEIDLAAFAEALRRENRTLKRALTDPRVLSGIGNAYSDEILHRARLSPVQLTRNLDDAEMEVLLEATRATLVEWTEKLRREAKGKWPERVTAFRPDFAVHGKFGEPCPVCATAVQRIVRGEHETNYCPRCQTGGKLLADRALSKLLHDDWPSTIEEWEERMRR